MSNPWEEIDLGQYERHMSLESVMQLQTMHTIMGDQLSRYPVSTAMILGVAGGNGLDWVSRTRLKPVYGVDVNRRYLQVCSSRYPALQGVFRPIPCDLREEWNRLPEAELIIANLLIEYVGYQTFLRVVRQVRPAHVSCVIQVNEGSGFVSDSPYLQVFDRLAAVHHQIDKNGLAAAMDRAGFRPLLERISPLPNGKSLLRLDFGLASSMPLQTAFRP